MCELANPTREIYRAKCSMSHTLECFGHLHKRVTIFVEFIIARQVGILVFSIPNLGSLEVMDFW